MGNPNIRVSGRQSECLSGSEATRNPMTIRIDHVFIVSIPVKRLQQNSKE